MGRTGETVWQDTSDVDEQQEAAPSRLRRAFLWLAAVIMLTALLGQVVAGVLPLASSPSGPRGLSHYENQWIALDYPSTFVVHEPGDSDFKWHPPLYFGGTLVVGLADPEFQRDERYTRLVRISRLEPRPYESLETVMKENYASIDPRWRVDKSPLVAPESLTVSGLAARQKAYRIHWDNAEYDVRDIWVPSNGNLFLISISTRWTENEDVASFQAEADAIVASLVIKRLAPIARR